MSAYPRCMDPAFYILEDSLNMICMPNQEGLFICCGTVDSAIYLTKSGLIQEKVY